MRVDPIQAFLKICGRNEHLLSQSSLLSETVAAGMSGPQANQHFP